MGRRRGVFVDLDGTLADNLGFMYDCYAQFMASFGLRGSQAEFQAYNGTPLAAVLADLRREHSLAASVPELLDDYHRMLTVGHVAYPPREGAVAFLQQAVERGISTCVVTSSPRSLACGWLEQQIPSGLIHHVISSDDVHDGKPSPAPYELALERSGCAREGSLAVEDSASGIESACSAGLLVAQVRQHPDDRRLRSAWRAISDFTELMDWFDAV